MDRDYLNLNYGVDNFKTGAKVVVEFQVNSRNFKASKKIEPIKIYLFCFLGIYLIDNPSNKTMLTPKKRCPKDNK